MKTCHHQQLNQQPKATLMHSLRREVSRKYLNTLACVYKCKIVCVWSFLCCIIKAYELGFLHASIKRKCATLISYFFFLSFRVRFFLKAFFLFLRLKNKFFAFALCNFKGNKSGSSGKKERLMNFTIEIFSFLSSTIHNYSPKQMHSLQESYT